MDRVSRSPPGGAGGGRHGAAHEGPPVPAQLDLHHRVGVVRVGQEPDVGVAGAGRGGDASRRRRQRSRANAAPRARSGSGQRRRRATGGRSPAPYPAPSSSWWPPPGSIGRSPRPAREARPSLSRDQPAQAPADPVGQLALQPERSDAAGQAASGSVGRGAGTRRRRELHAAGQAPSRQLRGGRRRQGRGALFPAWCRGRPSRGRSVACGAPASATRARLRRPPPAVSSASGFPPTGVRLRVKSASRFGSTVTSWAAEGWWPEPMARRV